MSKNPMMWLIIGLILGLLLSILITYFFGVQVGQGKLYYNGTCFRLLSHTSQMNLC